MSEEQSERRNINGAHRRQRVAMGGLSAPIAILVAMVVNRWFEKSMTDEEIIAVSAVVGSVVSTISICFWDLRGILLSYAFHRRSDDPARRPRRRKPSDEEG